MTREQFIGLIRTSEGCHNWPRGSSNDYGEVCIDGVTMTAHVASYTFAIGEVPKGLFVCHKCNNRRCFNPNHLYLGTPAQNSADAGRDGLIKRNSGQFKGRFCDEEVELMYKLKSEKKSYAEIGRIFNANRSTIFCILNNANYLPRRKEC